VRVVGVTAHKNQFMFRRAVLVESQVIFGMPWTPVFVSMKQTDIQIVSRILEVIRIAAEERDPLK
jgi:hypothetical protein